MKNYLFIKIFFQMTNNLVPTAKPADVEPSAGAETNNIAAAQDLDAPSNRNTQNKSSDPRGAPHYVLPRGVRVTVAVTSACVLVGGLALTVLGGISSSALPGFTGVNTIITGITVIVIKGGRGGGSKPLA